MQVTLLRCTLDPEALIEDAARTCYAAEPKDAPVGKLVRKLLGFIPNPHESPLEHAYATFRIEGVSRACSHQLVRHRLMAVSQRSQRYVNEGQFEYVVPPEIRALGKDDVEQFKDMMSTIQGWYAHWRSRGIKGEDARFVLPNACQTELVISADFREFRHIFRMRCDRHAQWEIRDCCTRMLVALHAVAPSVFEDLYSQYAV